MSALGKSDQHGKRGEARTEALLLDAFWTYRPPVDVAGGDFLIQRPVATLEELNRPIRALEVHGRVQAKFFGPGTAIKIPRRYVEDPVGPRDEFFAWFHTGEGDQRTHYFFTARDIIQNFQLSQSGGAEHFVFRLTKKRDFAAFRDLPYDRIVKKINTALDRAQHRKTREFLSSTLFNTYADAGQAEAGPYTYLFRIVEGCPVVLRRDESVNNSGRTRSLEPRRDLFEYVGDYAWGYAGTGPQFLTASLLAHHLRGRGFTDAQFTALLHQLVAALPASRPHDVDAADIDAVLESAANERSEPLTPRSAPSRTKRQLIQEMTKVLGPDLLVLSTDPSVRSVYVNAPGQPVRVLRVSGNRETTERPMSEAEILRFLAAAAEYAGEPLDVLNPTVWAELPRDTFGGAWVQGMVPPVAVLGPGFDIVTSTGLAHLPKDVR